MDDSEVPTYLFLARDEQDEQAMRCLVSGVPGWSEFCNYGTAIILP